VKKYPRKKGMVAGFKKGDSEASTEARPDPAVAEEIAPGTTAREVEAPMVKVESNAQKNFIS
jgi:hypothetical protein